MFGFIIGLASLIGLIAIVTRGRRRRWSWHHAHYGGPQTCGPRHGHGHAHEPGGGPGPWERPGRRFGMMWRLFERLDTTPGQEKAIREAVTDVEETVRGMRGEMRQGGGDISNALRGDSFDETVMGLM
ncbi:MAG: hypothetical protein JRH11_13375, partial [Deltaproteobacteria bacterium]|nr:hypothetical protein [Deltaproteobacteria bacterium]